MWCKGQRANRLSIFGKSKPFQPLKRYWCNFTITSPKHLSILIDAGILIRSRDVANPKRNNFVNSLTRFSI
jgi:hypothetical protein